MLTSYASTLQVGTQNARYMRKLAVAAIAVLSLTVMTLGAAVVRLENYRYANFLGLCGEYGTVDPMQRVKREDCLESTQTRTHWFWHILYGLKVL